MQLFYTKWFITHQHYQRLHQFKPVTVVMVDLSSTNNASNMEYGDRIIPPPTQYIQMYGTSAYPGHNYKKPDKGVIDSCWLHWAHVTCDVFHLAGNVTKPWQKKYPSPPPHAGWAIYLAPPNFSLYITLFNCYTRQLLPLLVNTVCSMWNHGFIWWSNTVVYWIFPSDLQAEHEKTHRRGQVAGSWDAHWV